MNAARIRDYRPSDETSWLRCRVLSFLDTCYYDAVETRKPVEEDADHTIELVAVDGDTVTGLANALLSIALDRLAATPAIVLDAWTREDRAALDWYTACGFVETESYLHVYSGYNRAVEMVTTDLPLRPVIVFADAAKEHEARMRAEFERVYVCRRMQRPLT